MHVLELICKQKRRPKNYQIIIIGQFQLVKYVPSTLRTQNSMGLPSTDQALSTAECPTANKQVKASSREIS